MEGEVENTEQVKDYVGTQVFRTLGKSLFLELSASMAGGNCDSVMRGFDVCVSVSRWKMRMPVYSGFCIRLRNLKLKRVISQLRKKYSSGCNISY